jgi:hypothetical protein
MAREGFDGGHPAIARVLDGIRRRYGTKQDAKTAILTEDLRHIVRAPPASLTGGRNSAVAQIRPVTAFEEWLCESSYLAGRSDAAVFRAIDPAKFAGYSLRSGFATRRRAAAPTSPSSCSRPGTRTPTSPDAMSSLAGCSTTQHSKAVKL